MTQIKYNIITAEQAKEISEENRYKIIETKIQPILKYIYEAAQKGEYKIRICDCCINDERILDDEIISYLKELGYKHKVDDCFYDIISWY